MDKKTNRNTKKSSKRRNHSTNSKKYSIDNEDIEITSKALTYLCINSPSIKTHSSTEMYMMLHSRRTRYGYVDKDAYISEKKLYAKKFDADLKKAYK